jgi:hypothetical protein
MFCVPLLVLSQQFGDLVNVSNAPDMIDTLPAIAVDKNNHAHIAWNGFYYRPEAPDSVASDIFYTNNKAGSFAAPVQISVPTGWYSRDPTIAVDSAGNAHIAFRRSDDQMTILNGDDIYYVTNADGIVDNPVLLVDGKDDYPGGPIYVVGPHFPRIHCDKQNNVHLLIQVYNCIEESASKGHLVYLTKIDGIWSDIEPTVEIYEAFFNEYASVVDQNGYVHIAMEVSPYYGRDCIYYTNNTEGAFSFTELASDTLHEAQEPDITVDSYGNAHIVYRDVHPQISYDIYYVNNISGKCDTWIPIGEITTYAFYWPSIAIDDSDYVHITYKKFGSTLYYGNNRGDNFNFISHNYNTSMQRFYNWVPGSNYFVLGDFSSIHIAFYHWVNDYDTEIFYLSSKWTETTSIQADRDIPKEFTLSQNYPNPFNPITRINFKLPQASHVVMKIYDIFGREVRTLIETQYEAGSYYLNWDARDDYGDFVSSGIYIYEIKAGKFSQAKKMTLIK